MISDRELDEILSERDPLDNACLETRSVKPPLARLGHDIATGPSLLQESPSPVRRVRTRHRLPLAAAAVVVVAAALTEVRLLAGGSTQSMLPGVQLPVAQAAQLDRIAQATAAEASAGHGKWLYLKVTSTVHQGISATNSPVVFYSVTQTVQDWSASAAGPTRVRITFSNFAFASARSRARYDSDRRLFDGLLAPLPLAPGHTAVADAMLPRGAEVSPIDIGGSSNSKTPLSSLPTQPGALVRLLGDQDVKGLFPGNPAQRKKQRQLVIDNEAYGEWHGLSQILIASTSARQRAEAYRALSLVRFVHVAGKRRDSLGRLGTAVTFHSPGPGPTETLIVDPRTGDLLQEDGGSGGVTVWLARAVVGSDVDLPGGGKQPAPRTTSTQSLREVFRATGGGLFR